RLVRLLFLSAGVRRSPEASWGLERVSGHPQPEALYCISGLMTFSFPERDIGRADVGFLRLEESHMCQGHLAARAVVSNWPPVNVIAEALDARLEPLRSI